MFFSVKESSRGLEAARAVSNQASHDRIRPLLGGCSTLQVRTSMRNSAKSRKREGKWSARCQAAAAPLLLSDAQTA